MIHSESRANQRLSVVFWRPREGHSWIDIAVVGLAETGADAAESLRPAGGEVKWVGASQHLVKYVEEAVARTQVHGEVRRPSEFILDVAVKLGLAQPIDGQVSIQGCCTYAVCIECYRRSVRDGSTLRVSLVQLNTPDLHSALHRVPALDPRQVVDLRKRVSHARADAVVVQRGESRD